MRTKILSAVISMLFFAVQLFATENLPPPKGPGADFEQHKAEILKRIDERIARNQEERNCVQAAKNREDIRICREKFKEEFRGRHQKQQ